VVCIAPDFQGYMFLAASSANYAFVLFFWGYSSVTETIWTVFQIELAFGHLETKSMICRVLTCLTMTFQVIGI